jgi:flagellar biogenesis protein FliO
MKVFLYSLVIVFVSIAPAFGQSGLDVSEDQTQSATQSNSPDESQSALLSENPSAGLVEDQRVNPVINQSKPITPSGEVKSSMGNDSAIPREEGNAGFQFPLYRTIGGMGLVICLMIGACFALKKFFPKHFGKVRPGKSLKIIETLAMGDRRSISLIEVGVCRFLVGNTPSQINMLVALPENTSLVSEPAAMPVAVNNRMNDDVQLPFRKLFEVEKNRIPDSAGNKLPEDLRTKMRQLREALERP